MSTNILISGWKLNKKIATRSIYNAKNTILNEYADPKMIASFLSNELGVDFSQSHPQSKYHTNEAVQLDKYVKQKYNDKKQCFNNKIYFPKHRWGRCIPTDYLSLSVFHRPTRHALCEGIYRDIDVVNCSQVLILEICKKNNHASPKLESYCADRENIIANIMTHHQCSRDIVKRLFISLSFGGSYEYWITTNAPPNPAKMEFMTAFEAEYAVIKTIVYENNKIIIEDVEKYNPCKFDKYTTPEGKEDAKKRTCMALWYQTLERHVQERMIIYLAEVKKMKLEDIVPCQDGLMILKELYYDGIIADCTNAVKNAFDIDISLIVKEFDEAIHIPSVEIHDIPEPPPAPFVSTINWDLSEAEFAKAFKRECFDDKPILFTGKGREPDGFIYNGVLWCPLSLHNAEIQKMHFDNLYEYYMEHLAEEKEFINPLFLKSITAMVKSLNTHKTRQNVVKIFKYENYVEDVEWNTHTNYFIFEDGIYDLNIGDFIEPNPDDYENLSCGYKYSLEFTHEELENAKKDIVAIVKSIVKPDDYKYLMTVISTFLIQNNFEEKAYFWLGNGRNGKGTLTTLLKKVLNKYWGELNTEYYTAKKQRADEPNQNLFNCKFSRVLNTSEVAKDDKTNAKVRFNNDAFTRITGNDTINARELGSKNVASFKAGKILIQLNDMPEFSKDISTDDISLRERIVVINFPYSFTSEQPKIDAEPDTYKPIDITIKRKFETDIYRRAMLDVMFDCYKEYLVEGLVVPHSVKAFTNCYFTTQSILGWFLNTYTPTEGGKVSIDTIHTEYKNEFDSNISKATLRGKLEKEKLTVRKSMGYYFVIGYSKSSTIQSPGDAEEDTDGEEVGSGSGVLDIEYIEY